MKAQDSNLYHCVRCGRIVHSKLEGKAPLCCGHTMEKAIAATVREGIVAGDAACRPGTATPDFKSRTKYQ